MPIITVITTVMIGISIVIIVILNIIVSLQVAQAQAGRQDQAVTRLRDLLDQVHCQLNIVIL